MVNKNKLRGAIVRSGHTQTSLSQKLGMSRNALSAKVNGRSPITTEEAKRICQELGIVNDQEKIEIFLA